MSDATVAALRQFCDETGFRFHPIGQSDFVALVGGRYGKWPVFCHIRDATLYFFSVLPATVPMEKQRAVLEYLNRINWQTAVGNFEMDPDDGEVRLRTSLDCADGRLTPRMVAVLLYRNLLTCDRYLPGLLQILVANKSPLQAFQAIEAANDDKELDTVDLNELLSDVDLDRLPDNDDD